MSPGRRRSVAGAGHAAGYSPLIARVTSLVEPRFASALSALNSTGPLLANVLAVATLGSLYFAAPTPSSGLTRVTTIIALLLLTATACATRVALTAAPNSGHTRDPAPARPLASHRERP